MLLLSNDIDSNDVNANLFYLLISLNRTEAWRRLPRSTVLFIVSRSPVPNGLPQGQTVLGGSGQRVPQERQHAAFPVSQSHSGSKNHFLNALEIRLNRHLIIIKEGEECCSLSADSKCKKACSTVYSATATSASGAGKFLFSPLLSNQQIWTQTKDRRDFPRWITTTLYLRIVSCVWWLFTSTPFIPPSVRFCLKVGKKKTETKKKLMVNQESAPTHMTFFKTVD